jgi:hypothetical protein
VVRLKLGSYETKQTKPFVSAGPKILHRLPNEWHFLANGPF